MQLQDLDLLLAQATFGGRDRHSSIPWDRGCDHVREFADLICPATLQFSMGPSCAP